MKKQHILAFILIFIAIVGIFLLTKEDNDQDEIVLGAVYSLSGDSAVLGQAEQNASQLAIDELNTQGGIRGRKLRVVWEDGKCSGKEALTAVQKLISIDRVKIVLAGGCSSEVLGFASETEKNNIIVMDITGTSPEISGAGEYIFRNVPNDSYAAKILASYAREREFSRAAVLFEQTDYARALNEDFAKEFQSRGGEVVAQESFLSTSKDVRAQITKIKAQDPGVIFLSPQSLTTGILAARQMRELGLSTPLLATAIILTGDQSEFQSAKQVFEGAVISQLDLEAVDRVRLDEFNKKYESRFGKPCEIGEYYCGYGYEIVYLLKEGLEACGEKTDCLKKYFYSIKDWPGIMGRLTIDKNGDAVRAYTLNKIANGKAVSL